MRKGIGFWAVLAVAGFAAAAAWGGTLRVVTTTADLKSIAEAVGGEKVQASSIAAGSQDPHHLEAKPSYMLVARRADLWVRVGLELEVGWEPLVLGGSRNPRIQVGEPGHLDASEGVKPLDMVSGFVSPFAGDIHPKGNPHYWLDPYNGRIVAKNIAQRLSQLSPANKDYFGQRLGEFLKTIDEHCFGEEPVKTCGGEALWDAELKGKLDDALKEHQATLGGWLGKLRPFRGAKIITYHRSWTYFVTRFGLVVADEMEPRPGVPPSPRHVADLIEKVGAEHIKLILMEPFYSKRDPDFVAGKTGARVVVAAASVGGLPEAKDYIALFDSVVGKTFDALQEK